MRSAFCNSEEEEKAPRPKTMSTFSDQPFDPTPSAPPAPLAPPPPSSPTDPTTSLPNTDEEAATAATEAQDRGTALIRDHLNAHLEQNPGSTYVSWIATLHPENADVTVDRRFLVPDNPWLTVYEEGVRRGGPGDGGGATPVPDDEEEDLKRGGGRGGPPVPPSNDGHNDDQKEDAVLVVSPSDEIVKPKPTGVQPAPPPPKVLPGNPKTYGGIIDLTVGLSISLAGAAVAIGIECCSAVVFIFESFFSTIARWSSTPRVTVLTFLPFLICYPLAKTLRLVDVILLCVSVSVIEILAGTNAMVCAMLALSCDAGRAAHQRTRRLAHLTRWACRSPFDKWERPSRATVSCGGDARRGGGDVRDNKDDKDELTEATAESRF